MSLTREQWDLQFPNDPLPTYLGIDGQFIPERYIPFDTTNLKTHDVIVSEDGQYLMYFKEDESYKIYDQSPFKFLVNPFKEWKKFGYELPVDDIKKSAVEYFKPLQEEFNKKLNEAWKHASQAKRRNEFEIEVRNPTSPEILARMQDERQGTHTTITNMTREEIKEKYDVDIPDDRYFTPSIEDIRVGYECEIWWNYNYLSENEWCSVRALEGSTEDFDLFDFTDRIRKKEIRVPYLTKEQIEKEGWVSYQGNTLIALNKGDFYIWYSEFSKILSIDQGKHPNKRTRFIGECKDINTFRYICKLLKI